MAGSPTPQGATEILNGKFKPRTANRISGRKLTGVLKFHPLLARRPRVPIISAPCCERLLRSVHQQAPPSVYLARGRHYCECSVRSFRAIIANPPSDTPEPLRGGCPTFGSTLRFCLARRHTRAVAAGAPLQTRPKPLYRKRPSRACSALFCRDRALAAVHAQIRRGLCNGGVRINVPNKHSNPASSQQAPICR